MAFDDAVGKAGKVTGIDIARRGYGAPLTLGQATDRLKKSPLVDQIVDATYLQDGQWEKSYANSIRHEFANAPDMIQTLVTSYYELMNASMDNEQFLNSFILSGELTDIQNRLGYQAVFTS